ncbi:hypothetical protein M758_2G093100 [Ceratodon purpureus]|uniref:DUF7781 domain-containing protein n=1 Tax=Ceratodon purpureus TaxID=3225 RepID=A0A8T0ITB9_CERPU|nr:hypothetical protein KC19_2G075400 [Ceratodon purpureus]KAG0625975.1 hypothetical protein M758_2G093100 [Ceratodon purpureus]
MEGGGQARGTGYASSSSHALRSASPVRSDSRGFRAAVRDVGQKLQEFYTFDLMPKIFIVKFRQQVQGIQLGANFEFDGVQVDGMHLQKCNADDCHTKLVIKPCSENGYWKVICEPKQRDLRILTKKIPLGSLLHFQFGIGHDFMRKSTGWKWKVTSAFGLPGSPEIRQKTKLPVFPGFDINVDWNAQYELPELHGASGTGEPPVEANLGHLHAKIERVAAVYTHVG